MGEEVRSKPLPPGLTAEGESVSLFELERPKACQAWTTGGLRGEPRGGLRGELRAPPPPNAFMPPSKLTCDELCGLEPPPMPPLTGPGATEK